MTTSPPHAELLRYLQAMLAENEHVNLTGIRDPEAARVLHVEDSLAIAGAGLLPKDALDLGSGNGFPGVALRVLFRDAKVTLLERTRKKCLAIERVLAASGIRDVAVLCMDAGQAPGLDPKLRGRFDLITARAVGAPPEVARLATPLLAPLGKLALWIDGDSEPDAALGSRLKLWRALDYELSAPAARRRKLAIYELQPAPKHKGC